MDHTIALDNGVLMPALGFGTFKLRGQLCEDVVRDVVREGVFTHIDTASCYRNEGEVGRALQGLRRDSFFLTSKVAPREMGFEAASVAIDNILNRLQLGYVDLLLIHWPGRSPLKGDDPRNAAARIETWRALEQAYGMGKCRAIGVSNFTVRHLEHLLPHCIVRPQVNQVEFHVRLQQWDLLQFCSDQRIHLSAYSPLGCGNLLADAAVATVATELESSPAQTLLAFVLHHGMSAIVKSSSLQRAQENAASHAVRLHSAHVDVLRGLHTNTRLCWDPDSVL